MSNENNKEEDVSYMLTPPMGGLFGIGTKTFYHFKLLNLAEGIALAGGAGWVISQSPLTPTFKLVVMVCICVPLFAFAIRGMDEMDLLTFTYQAVRCRLHGVVYAYRLPAKEKKAKKAKEPVKKETKKRSSGWGRKTLLNIAEKLDE